LAICQKSIVHVITALLQSPHPLLAIAFKVSKIPGALDFHPKDLGIVILDQYISSQVPAHFISENTRQQSIAGSSPSYSTGVLKGDLLGLHRTQLSGRRNKLRKRCR